MSVLIKGAEIPKDCFNCIFYSREWDWCDAANKNLFHAISQETRKADWCPLVEVPPHGRLMDADAYRKSLRESIDECQEWANEVEPDTEMYARISQSLGTFVECSLRAKAMPTIIEAEGEV